MKEFVLLLSSGDWGDEFDLEGFAVFEKEIWEEIKEGIPNEPFEAYFGTNEFVTFDGKDDYLSRIKEKPITEEDAKFLANLLEKRFEPDKSWNSIEYGLFVINSENY